MCVSHTAGAEDDSSPLILLVEDDADLARLLTEVLSREIFEGVQASYQVKRAVSAEAAKLLLRSTPPVVCIVEHHPPVINGFTLHDHLCAIYATERIPMLLIVNDLPQRELAWWQFTSLQKPFDLEHFIQVIQVMIGVRG